MTAQKEQSTLKLVVLVLAWYAGNTLYNIFNKTASRMLHAHWFLACSQLVVGIVWSITMWSTGLRKTPNLTAADISRCIPIGLSMCIAHGGSVLATGAGSVSFAQIVKACEPVYAATLGLLVPPLDVKTPIVYAMLIPIVGGVGLACVKEGKGIDINYEAFAYASVANLAAAFKGKLGGSVTKSLKKDPSKNMDSANVYAVNNIISFLFTLPMVIYSELPTLREEWEIAESKHGFNALCMNIALSGFFYYIYNEFAFAFTASVGSVTSSVLNTAKRVIIIVVSAVLFNESMEKNTVMGSAIAISGTFAYSVVSKLSSKDSKEKKA